MSVQVSCSLPLTQFCDSEEALTAGSETSNATELEKCGRKEREVHPPSKSMDRGLSNECCKSALTKRDIDPFRTSKELSLFEKIERFDEKDQISLIDMTRAHQSDQQGQLTQGEI
ncbi:hypothetical protein K3495_g4253 [Podosphaera aphanis]|nr:hypothetical protein K3495_g4253 [Podosphaera aphanis]